MLMNTWNILKRRYRQQSDGYQYYNRVLRAMVLRALLWTCRIFFGVEKQVNPVRNPGEKRILLIVFGGMGDCLLFDSLFRRLKERWPRVVIDVLTGSFEQMWEHMETVDNLIVFKPTKFKTPWAYARLFRTLYRRGYELAVEGIAMVPKRGIYPLLTSFVMQASAAPVRIGRKNTGRLEALRPRRLDFMGHAEMMARRSRKLDRDANPYLTHTISVPPPHHRTSHESAYVLAPLGLNVSRRPDEPGLTINPDADQWARRTLRNQWACAQDRLIAMTVETTRRIKAWPLERFARVMHKGVRDGYKFVMLGLDKQMAAGISRSFGPDRVMNLAGSTNLTEMIALIRQCDLFVSCDTGPAHIAQACRVPTVVLFGPSNENEFGPADRQLHTLVLPPETLNCRPCVLGPCVRDRSCVQLIRPETVYAAMQETLTNVHPGREHRRTAPRTRPLQRLCEI
jgi:ADP-heptose:LPS heptosyltransferase